MGDTVNVASRLEHLGPVGAVLVAHDTSRPCVACSTLSAGERPDKETRRRCVRTSSNGRRATGLSHWRRGHRGCGERDGRIADEERRAFARPTPAWGSRTGAPRLLSGGCGRRCRQVAAALWFLTGRARAVAGRIYSAGARSPSVGAPRGGLVGDIVADTFRHPDGARGRHCRKTKLREGIGTYWTRRKPISSAHWLGFEPVADRPGFSPAANYDHRARPASSNSRFAGGRRGRRVGRRGCCIAADRGVPRVAHRPSRGQASDRRLLMIGTAHPTCSTGCHGWPGRTGTTSARLDLLRSALGTLAAAPAAEDVQRVDPVPEEASSSSSSAWSRRQCLLCRGSSFWRCWSTMVRSTWPPTRLVRRPRSTGSECRAVDADGCPSAPRLDSLAASERRTLQSASILGRSLLGSRP